MTDTAPTLKILKPGSFIDIHGTKVTFTRADLAEVAASYDVASDPAPLVLGHPTHDGPAHGWVGSLAVVGDELQALPSDVTPELSELVAAKRFRKLSASLYPPAHPSNPKPGQWYLRHVGFLGASAPGVKGLGTVAFSAAEDEAAITLVPDLETDMTDTPEAIALAERETAIASREATLEDREAELVEREATIIAGEKLAVTAANVAFAEAQVSAGRLAPAGKGLVVGILDALTPLDVVSFGEADGDLQPAAAFRQLLEGANPIVSLAELAPADVDPPEVDTETPAVIADKAISFMEAEHAAGRTITIQEAVRHVHRDAAAAD